jgi:hypothetical protein
MKPKAIKSYSLMVFPILKTCPNFIKNIFFIFKKSYIVNNQNHSNAHIFVKGFLTILITQCGLPWFEDF